MKKHCRQRVKRLWIWVWKKLRGRRFFAASEETKEREAFSPLTYRNPCISYFGDVFAQVLKMRQLAYRDLELVLVDADAGNTADDDDIHQVLSRLSPRLNYLLLITDRPVYYQSFVHTMYEENGLIVQRVPSDAKRIRGNVVLDFSRSGAFFPYALQSAGASVPVYIPLYKKPWEIRENLDIEVPVGYNTLVVTGACFMRRTERETAGMDKMEDKIERLD